MYFLEEISISQVIDRKHCHEVHTQKHSLTESRLSCFPFYADFSNLFLLLSSCNSFWMQLSQWEVNLNSDN